MERREVRRDTAVDGIERGKTSRILWMERRNVRPPGWSFGWREERPNLQDKVVNILCKNRNM
jgi:hypothetical protein